jgi:hypothetical protein
MSDVTFTHKTANIIEEMRLYMHMYCACSAHIHYLEVHIFRSRSFTHCILALWAQGCYSILKLHSPWSYCRGECSKCGKHGSFHHKMDTKLKYVAPLMVRHSEPVHSMLGTHSWDPHAQWGALSVACTVSKFSALFLLQLIWTNTNEYFKPFNLIRHVLYI